MNTLSLDKMLQSQGWGSRKECRTMITRGRLSIKGKPVTDPSSEIQVKGLIYNLDGSDFKFREKIIIAIHKPQGYECTRASTHHLTIFDLLPDYLIKRDIQCVGRLDQDTTGLLLLTDDGPLLHRLTSPKHHVKKTYQVTTGDPVTNTLIGKLCEGVKMRGEEVLVQALECKQTGERLLEMTLDEGKYHQVKRMLAAAGNSCQGLIRISTGQLTLKSLGLEEGQWCELTEAQMAMVHN